MEVMGPLHDNPDTILTNIFWKKCKATDSFKFIDDKNVQLFLQKKKTIRMEAKVKFTSRFKTGFHPFFLTPSPVQNWVMTLLYLGKKKNNNNPHLHFCSNGTFMSTVQLQLRKSNQSRRSEADMKTRRVSSMSNSNLYCKAEN